MAKTIDYGKLFTLRADGRYCASYTDKKGRHYLYDRNPERLFFRMQHRNDPKPPTVQDLADAWDAEHIEQVGYKTFEAYRAPIRRLVEYIGTEKAEDVTTQEIYALLADMAEKQYSRRSVQLQRDVCNMIFRFGILKGKIRYNPCVDVKMPRNLKTVRRELPSDEAIEAVKNGVSEPFGLFAYICLYAGLRRGEALALCFEDIDRQNKVIHVNKAIEYVGENPHIKSTKTEAGRRDVILLDVLAAQIPKKKKGLVFGREDGEPLKKTQYRRKWDAYCKAIGHEITAHQLRHGYATILYEAGVPDKDAQELLGHSNIMLTRNIYTHIRQARKQETADRLNAYIGKK